jgi:pilus assembly protein Flp/PilA
MFQKIKNFLSDANGASAAEYALILAIVTTGIAGAAVALGDSIDNAIGDATMCIETAGVDCDAAP